MNNIKKDNNKKGFTLIELLAAIILLAIVMSISAVSVIGVINKSKSNSYDSLIEYAKIGSKSYFEECDNIDIVGPTKIDCSKIEGNELKITFGDLLKYGFLVSSSKRNDLKIVENPYNNENMNNCLLVVTKVTTPGGKVDYEYQFDNRYECSKIKRNSDEPVSTPSSSSTIKPSISPSPSNSPTPPTTPSISPTPTRTIRPIISPSPSPSNINIRPVESPKLEKE